MTKRNSRLVAITMAALMVMLAAVACVPWLVVHAAEDVDALEVTGYSIYTKDKSGNYTVVPKTITKGTQFKLILSVYDARMPDSYEDSASPQARINTSSFTGSVTPSAVSSKSYTLEFLLTYSGTG